MRELKERIHDDKNGLDYVLCGDYYIPDLKLQEEHISIGRWGRMHLEYIKEHRPTLYSNLLFSGNLWAYLADLNEQAQARLDVIMAQMQEMEGITENLKCTNQMEWVRAMNSIRNRAEEIILHEMIYTG